MSEDGALLNSYKPRSIRSPVSCLRYNLFFKAFNAKF